MAKTITELTPQENLVDIQKNRGGRPRKQPKPTRKRFDHDGNAASNQRRQDGWINIVTGMGDYHFDKSVNTYYQRDLRLDDDQLSGMYYGNDIAALIVDAYVDESFRVGYEINLTDDADNQLKDKLDIWKPAIDQATQDLLRWGRLFGGAAIYLDVEDGENVTEPLDLSKVTKINSLRVFDRRYVWPLGYDSDPTSPSYWLPEFYGFGGSLAGAITSPRVHHSRLLRVVGVEADRREAQYLSWWGHSVLQKCYNAIRNFGLTEQSTVLMMQDATQAVFYIKGLADAIASDDDETVQNRMQLVDMQRNVGRAVLLDAGSEGNVGSEKAEKLTTPFAGVADVTDRFQSRVAAAARMPVSILFGNQKGGIGGDSGEGDLRTWHAGVQAYQVRTVEPILRRLYAIVGAVLGVDTALLKFAWTQLHEPTASEQADIEQKIGTRDVAYVTAGILRPEEVALSRFGSGKFSMVTTIDTDLYQIALMHAPAPSTEPPPNTQPAPDQGTAVSASGPTPAPGIAQSKVGPENPQGPAPTFGASSKGAPNAKEAQPLAAGEVGGSNEQMSPQIVDPTGRGAPIKDRERNKLTPDISTLPPDRENTPAPTDKPKPDAATPPAKDNSTAGQDVNESTTPDITVKSGDTTIKVKQAKKDK